MKTYFRSLFEKKNRWLTLSFLIVSAIFIGTVLTTGLRNNATMSAFFITGIVFLYLAFIHKWKNERNFLYLATTTGILFIILFIITLVISLIPLAPENNGTSKIHVITGGIYSIIAIGICIPGMTVGMVGFMIRRYKNYRAVKV